MTAGFSFTSSYCQGRPAGIDRRYNVTVLLVVIGEDQQPPFHTGDVMKLRDFLLSEINREIDRSRRVLEEVPPDKYDWKPHEKSMIFGYLANMVATIPTWIT